MNVIDLRVKLIQSLEQQIKKELSELQIPSKIIDRKDKLLSGRTKEELLSNVGNNISESEAKTFRNLKSNNIFRLREFERAMGMLLLFSRTPIDTSEIQLDPDMFRLFYDDRDNIAAYTELFWTSYGDFNIKSCSLLDSIGIYLAFVFFGLIDAPLYFNQIIDTIKLKYTKEKRVVVDGDPFTLQERESWKILCDAKARYHKIRSWRDEITHAFSPIMYRLTDVSDLDYTRRKILRSPTLDVKKILNAAEETYYLLGLVPLAANDLAEAFIGTDSYHRNFYF